MRDEDLGDLSAVNDQTIYAWRKQELNDTGQLPGLSRAEQSELSAAKKRIRELENDVAILKRAHELLRERTTQKAIRGHSPCVKTELAAGSGVERSRQPPSRQAGCLRSTPQSIVVRRPDGADGRLDASFGEPLAEAFRCVLGDPRSLWWTTSFKSKTPSRCRVQMACSMASSTIEVAIVAATGYPGSGERRHP